MSHLEPDHPLNPPTEEYRKQTTCPSCGRFIGVFERCPYCQALVQKRLSIKVFKVFALLTSTVGLLLLLFFARTIKTPEVKIEQLGPLSNFAHVKVTGTVERSYGLHPQWKSLTFSVQQPDSKGGIGSIRVSAYAKVAVEIEKRGLVPMDGDEISVEGQVRFQKETPSLLITAVEHLTFSKRADNGGKDQAILEPSQVHPEMVGRSVAIKGVVVDLVGFPRGMLIRVDDGKQGLAVWIPSRVAEDLSVAFQPGDTLEARGKVKPYKDSVEIEVTSANGIKLLQRGKGEAPRGLPPSEREEEVVSALPKDVEMASFPAPAIEEGDPNAAGEIPPYATVSSIKREMGGTSVRIVGILRKINSFKSGLKLQVADDSGEIAVWLPVEVSAGLPIPSEGAKVSAEGKVGEFKEELQIQIQKPADLSVLP